MGYHLKTGLKTRTRSYQTAKSQTLGQMSEKKLFSKLHAGDPKFFSHHRPANDAFVLT